MQMILSSQAPDGRQHIYFLNRYGKRALASLEKAAEAMGKRGILVTAKAFTTLMGIQGSVMGWDDPWHYEQCDTVFRTGERKYFPSQDPRPSPERFIRELGADFYLHPGMPEGFPGHSPQEYKAGLEMAYLMGAD